MEHTAPDLLLHLARLAAESFVSGLWQGLVILAAAAVALRLLRRSNAALRFALWGFAFALILAVPLLQLRATGGAPGSASAAPLHLGIGWGCAIAGLWAILMAARGLQLLRQALRLRAVWRRAEPVVAADPGILPLLQAGRRTAELCTSADVESPSVIGFFAPRLLLPASLHARLTGAELRQIILHECEHLRRGDDWINLLQKVALALFPLNPALLWVDRRLSLERELACDAGVVASTAAPLPYAHCLTRLAEHRLGRRPVALSLSAWGRRSELTARVHSLLEPAKTLSPLHAKSFVALLSLGLAAGAVELARVPRLVAFSEVPVAAAASRAALVPVASPIPPGPRALAVTYQPAGPAPATLRNAVMHLPNAPRNALVNAPSVLAGHRSSVARNAPAGRTERHSAHGSPIAPPQRARLLLTTAAPAPAAGHQSRRAPRIAAPHLVYTVGTDFPTYAAVPFGDGWLIVQL